MASLTPRSSRSDRIRNISLRIQIFGIACWMVCGRRLCQSPQRRRSLRLPPLSIVGKAAAIVSICFFVAIAVYMELQHHQATQRRAREAEFVAGAKQGVINMTSLDFNKAKEDVQRVIDSSTGEFKEDFQQRANTFTSVVQQSKAITEGTVNATALQSMNGNSASILVAATSRITNSPPGKDEPARVWRLKVTVTEVDGQYKMSKVEYVP